MISVVWTILGLPNCINLHLWPSNLLCQSFIKASNKSNFLFLWINLSSNDNTFTFMIHNVTDNIYLIDILTIFMYVPTDCDNTYWLCILEVITKWTYWQFLLITYLLLISYLLTVLTDYSSWLYLWTVLNNCTQCLY